MIFNFQGASPPLPDSSKRSARRSWRENEVGGRAAPASVCTPARESGGQRLRPEVSQWGENAAIYGNIRNKNELKL